MHQVRYVLALHRSSNFTRAAKACGVSQPSLTRAIRRLEDELGGLLFHRSRGGIRLTELGTIMLPHLEEIAARATIAKDEAGSLMRGSKETLRLGVMCTIAPNPIITVITAVGKNYPNIDIKITDFMSSKLETQLVDSKLDVALYSTKVKQLEHLHYHPIFQEQMMIVLHPKSPFASKDVIRADDLKEQNYLNRIHCEFDDLAIRNPAVRNWKVAHSSDRDDWILGMVAAGMGFGLLPAHVIWHPGVVARPLKDPELWRHVSIVSVRGRKHSPAVGALVREAIRIDWKNASLVKP